MSRRHSEIISSGTYGIPVSGSSTAQKKAVILFFSHLNEKQRRLYAGLESLKLGHGGDMAVADLLGLSGSLNKSCGFKLKSVKKWLFLPYITFPTRRNIEKY